MSYVNKLLQSILPFLRWFPVNPGNARADLVAGGTVALVLIPQSMAYAQLAGLPAYFGLYASFLPVIVAALWGSCSQLTTGPVAMTSLLTAAALAPLAALGTAAYIQLAILLAFIAGLIRILLGVFQLGIIVNFVSFPVILGFTNAAALVISMSQLDKLLGVPRAQSDSFLVNSWSVVQQLPEAHLPTVLFGVGTLAFILFFKRIRPGLPGVLIAVPLTILLSWATGFERKVVLEIEGLPDSELKQLVTDHLESGREMADLRAEIAHENYRYNTLRPLGEEATEQSVRQRHTVELLMLRADSAETRNETLRYDLFRKSFVATPPDDSGGVRYFAAGSVPAGIELEGGKWQVARIDANGRLTLSSGGAVVGSIPSGLPSLTVPQFDLQTVLRLLPNAFVLVLIGFMEAISIARAIATKTRQRFDVNQELVGIGLANIAGSFTSSYPVGGSFSRSALNLGMGAKTGLSSVFAGLIVMIVLLFLTPLFYHLPQAVLAAVIINAVIGLFSIKPLIVAFKAKYYDAAIAVITFAAALGFAPQLDRGIYIGAGLAIIIYLARRTKPRVAILGRHRDGTLRDARHYHLQTCDQIEVFRFDGSLDYPDVSYFEDAILDLVANKPKLRFVHIVADGINFIDASGVVMLRNVHQQLKELGIQIVFSDLKRQVSEVFVATGFFKELGHKNIFRTKAKALDAIFSRIDDPEFDAEACPLRSRRRTAPAEVQKA